MAPHEVCDFSLDQMMRPARKWFSSSVQFADITRGFFISFFSLNCFQLAAKRLPAAFKFQLMRRWWLRARLRRCTDRFQPPLERRLVISAPLFAVWATRLDGLWCLLWPSYRFETAEWKRATATVYSLIDLLWLLWPLKFRTMAACLFWHSLSGGASLTRSLPRLKLIGPSFLLSVSDATDGLSLSQSPATNHRTAFNLLNYWGAARREFLFCFSFCWKYLCFRVKRSRFDLCFEGHLFPFRAFFSLLDEQLLFWRVSFCCPWLLISQH